MNELQLHSRLSDLADDLAPGDDPFELIAGARALHRRRRRARIGVAGAALAVALVAVGVPTAVNTLSVPDRGDVATPTTPTSTVPTEGPPGAAEELTGVAENLGAALTRVGAATSVPDPEEGFPCPDATDALSRATGMYVLEPEGINAGGGTLTGCGWTSTGMDDRPEEQRMAFQLRAEFDTDTDRLLEVLQGGVLELDCSWTMVPSLERWTPLQVCPDGSMQLVRLDEDGHGAWVLRAQTGEHVPESYGTKLGTLAELWHQVDLLDGADAPDPSPADAEPEITPMNREFNELAEALLDRREPVVLRAGEEWSCPGGTAELELSLATALTEGPVRTSQPPQPVCWWTAGPTPTSDSELADALSISIGFEPGVEELLGSGWTVGGSGNTATDDICLSFEISGDPPSAMATACKRGESTHYTVTVLDAGGAGTWTLTVQVPEASPVDRSTATLALVDLADRIW